MQDSALCGNSLTGHTPRPWLPNESQKGEKKVDHSTGSLLNLAFFQLPCIVTDAGQTLSTGIPLPVFLRVDSSTSDTSWGGPSVQCRVVLLIVFAAS